MAFLPAMDRGALKRLPHSQLATMFMMRALGVVQPDASTETSNRSEDWTSDTTREYNTANVEYRSFCCRLTHRIAARRLTGEQSSVAPANTITDARQFTHAMDMCPDHER